MALLSFVILRFIGMKKRTNKIPAKKQDVPNTGHPVFPCLNYSSPEASS